MLFLILIFLVALVVFIGVETLETRSAAMDRNEKKNPARAGRRAYSGQRAGNR
jgi:hypothetical protein